MLIPERHFIRHFIFDLFSVRNFIVYFYLDSLFGLLLNNQVNLLPDIRCSTLTRPGSKGLGELLSFLQAND